MKNLFVSVLLLVLLAGCTNPLDNVSKEKIKYNDYKDEYFSIKYPKDWNVEKHLDSGSHSILFSSKRENSEDLLLDDAIVEVYEKTNDFKTFTDFENFEKKLMYEKEQIKSRKEISFKGYAALRMDLEGLDSDTKAEIKTTVIYFTKDDRVFRITYAYESDKEQKFIPIFTEMMDSFEVKYVYKPEVINYKQYEDEYFKIVYPEKWDVSPDDLGVNFVSKVENANDLVQEDLYAATFWKTENLSTLKDLEALEEKDLYEDEEVKSSTEFKFKGNDAIKMTVVTKDSSSTRIIIYLIRDNDFARVSYAYENSKEEKYVPIFEKMLESFEMKTVIASTESSGY